MDSIQQIGTEVGQKFLPEYEKLTTSDLQACIAAEVGKRLTGMAARHAEEVALDYIYSFFGA